MNKPNVGNIPKRAQCTGCYACYSACPSKAIYMQLDDDGFLSPAVDSDKCIHCGLCQKICPVLNYPAREYVQPRVFAAYSNDEKTRLQSSSGGVFSEIAKHVIKNGGAVFGAAFDETFTLNHVCVKSEPELKKLRGSKYVQSHIGDAFKVAIKIAKLDLPVLFCGTPCQIAALNNLLNKNDATNLYLCDLICYGVASELVFKKYLTYLSQKGDSISEYHFRDKRLDWTNFGSNAIFSDKTEYFKSHYKDVFMVGYSRNIYHRESCYSCPFSRIPRQSDITLGDYWGIPKNLYDKRGVSAVLLNTSKGMTLFNELGNVTKTLVPLENVSTNNVRLINGKLNKPPQRADFFLSLKTDDFQTTIQKYLKPTTLMHVLFLKNKALKRFRNQ